MFIGSQHVEVLQLVQQLQLSILLIVLVPVTVTGIIEITLIDNALNEENNN